MNKSEIINNLISLLKISTESKNFAGIKEAEILVKSLLKDLPLSWHTVQKENAAQFLYAKTLKNDPNKPMILMSTHIDTVYSSNEVEIKETKTKVYGSGTQDMKGSIVAVVEILKKLYAENKLENIVFYICPEEEIATLNYRQDIEKLAVKADYCLVFESTLDREPKADLNKRSVVTSRRGFKQFWLEIKNGPGGHSGVLINKNERHSAALLVSEIALKIETLADYKKETTLNIGTIKAGSAINIIAPTAEIFFETRFRTQDEFRRVEFEVQNLVEFYNKKEIFQLELKETGFYPPFESNGKEKQFLEICHQAAGKLNLELIEEFRGGGSEASLIKHSNPKCAVLDGFGIRGEAQHTKTEFIFKESIFSTIEFVSQVVTNLI